MLFLCPIAWNMKLDAWGFLNRSFVYQKRSQVRDGLAGAGRVDAAAEAAGEDGGEEGEDHLGRVEAHDADSLLSLEAYRQQPPGRGPRRRVVLLVRPRDPFPVSLHGHCLDFIVEGDCENLETSTQPTHLNNSNYNI